LEARHFIIKYSEKFDGSSLKKAPKNIQGFIQRAIEDRLMTEPLKYGKALKYNLKGLRSLRTSHLRILYSVDTENLIVTIVVIDYRKHTY
jgi:mRNA interferase RelE/StbE